MKSSLREKNERMSWTDVLTSFNVKYKKTIWNMKTKLRHQLCSSKQILSRLEKSITRTTRPCCLQLSMSMFAREYNGGLRIMSDDASMHQSTEVDTTLTWFVKSCRPSDKHVLCLIVHWYVQLTTIYLHNVTWQLNKKPECTECATKCSVFFCNIFL